MRQRAKQGSRGLSRMRAAAVPWILLVFLLSVLRAWSQPGVAPRVSMLNAPAPIYGPDPKDAWNRIFGFLFSRRMEVRLSDEFPEGAPFTKERIDMRLGDRGLSLRTFERIEIGDRAIDPFYPSSFVAWSGSAGDSTMWLPIIVASAGFLLSRGTGQSSCRNFWLRCRNTPTILPEIWRASRSSCSYS